MATMSTGLKDEILDTGSLKAALADGYIHIYKFNGSTDVPGPDDAVDTVSDYILLATIYSDGGAADAGLEFGSASSGVLQKASGETWDNSSEQNLATGQAAFYVHVGSTESDGNALGASTTLPRIVGTVAAAGGDMNLSDTTLTEDEVQSITYYSVTIG